MKIILTKNAYIQLKTVLPEKTSVRIIAQQTSGWGSTIVYELAQDEQLEHDEVYLFEEITILVNPEVQAYLDGDIVIDHTKNYGYVLKNDYEILTFGMKLKKS